MPAYFELLAIRGFLELSLGSPAEAHRFLGPLPDAGDVLMGPVVSLSAYVFMTVISVLKPWGLTRRGRRLRAAARRPVTPVRPADYPGGSIVPVAGE